MRAREKFWIFGVRPHQDDVHLGKSLEKRRFRRSRITPAEAALMLDVPNMIMVVCDGEPAPFSSTAYGYAESFCTLNKVLWGATGSSGFRFGSEEKFICALAEKYPNIAGAFLDDFHKRLMRAPDPVSEGVSLLSEIRNGLDKACRPMDLYVVWYTHLLNDVDERLHSYIDGVTIWTWHCEELAHLRENFEAMERIFHDKKKMLGIYMYDFPSGMPLTDEQMELQCEFGLEMLKQGRIEGMIFEANSVMGVGLPSEMWLREWIRKVKDTELPD